MKLKTVSLQLIELRTLLEDTEVAPTYEVMTNTYKAILEQQRALSPLSVCFDGTLYWLFDGYHRLAAMQTLGFQACEVTIYRGTHRDALRRYIKDKLRCKGKLAIFRHCIHALNADETWSVSDGHTLAKLFGRKPVFFENIALFKSQERPGELVRFSVNKHGTYDLYRVRSSSTQ
jgi:uncharacterized ParB-like nuclease family protein